MKTVAVVTYPPIWSPIPALTALSVEQPRWARPVRYCYTP